MVLPTSFSPSLSLSLSLSLPLSPSPQVPPELAGYVTHIAFYETHLTSSNTCTPCMLASTKGSAIIRYTLTLPPPRDRNDTINRAFIAGEC